MNVDEQPSDAPTTETDAQEQSFWQAFESSPEFLNVYISTEQMDPVFEFARRLERSRDKWKKNCLTANETVLEVMRERDEARAELAELKAASGVMPAIGDHGVREIVQPPPTEGSAVEWVNGRRCLETGDISERDALELARRCDSYARIADALEKAGKEQVAAAQAELADRRDSDRCVLSEQCPSDERHCACVPALRREAARLREALEKMLHLCEHDLGMDEENPYIELAYAALAKEGQQHGL